MRIMIFDVAADSGGALSVLQDYYQDLVQNPDGNEYFFVISIPELKEMQNITVINFPWIKRSWFLRIYFDHIVAPRLISQYGIEKIISLQNLTIPHIKQPQTILVHNALPFAEYRFSIFRDAKLWVYQNLVGALIKMSIRKADFVMVQTQWMKKVCIDKLRIDEKKISIFPPKLSLQAQEKYIATDDSLMTFFFPASAVKFKNHQIVVKAFLKMKRDNISGYKVIFTLKGDENREIKRLYRTSVNNQLPISFIGQISRNQVYEYYSTTTLLFPSNIESSPLPLSEARMHGTPIIASDTMFSHEVLSNYDKAIFFNPNSKIELIEKILQVRSFVINQELHENNLY